MNHLNFLIEYAFKLVEETLNKAKIFVDYFGIGLHFTSEGNLYFIGRYEA
jgi:hypothetical protein